MFSFNSISFPKGSQNQFTWFDQSQMDFLGAKKKYMVDGGEPFGVLTEVSEIKKDIQRIELEHPTETKKTASDLKTTSYTIFFKGKQLGGGTYGNVYVLTSANGKEHAALKISKFRAYSTFSEPMTWADCMNEAELTAEVYGRAYLSHRINIQGTNEAYLFMDLLPPTLMDRYVEDNIFIPTDEALKIYINVVKLIIILNEKLGISYEDLFYTNICLDDKSNAYLCDFGNSQKKRSDKVASDVLPPDLLGLGVLVWGLKDVLEKENPLLSFSISKNERKTALYAGYCAEDLEKLGTRIPPSFDALLNVCVDIYNKRNPSDHLSNELPTNLSVRHRSHQFFSERVELDATRQLERSVRSCLTSEDFKKLAVLIKAYPEDEKILLMVEKQLRESISWGVKEGNYYVLPLVKCISNLAEGARKKILSEDTLQKLRVFIEDQTDELAKKTLKADFEIAANISEDLTSVALNRLTFGV